MLRTEGWRSRRRSLKLRPHQIHVQRALRPVVVVVACIVSEGRNPLSPTPPLCFAHCTESDLILCVVPKKRSQPALKTIAKVPESRRIVIPTPIVVAFVAVVASLHYILGLGLRLLISVSVDQH